MLFTIEGPIACGKSTVLRGLAAKGIYVFPEPTATWKPWLEEYYASSTPEAALILQRRILASLIFRHHLIAEVWDRFPNGIFVMERSLFSAASLFADVSVLKSEFISGRNLIYIQADSRQSLNTNISTTVYTGD